MTKNYIFFEDALKLSCFKGVLKKSVLFLILGGAANSYYAQSGRVVEDPQMLARLSLNELGSIITPKLPSVKIIKPSSKKVALNGVYTVGTSGNYATLTAAVADFNSSAITGPVTFQLLDATYPAETFPIVINANAGSSATNSLLIKPASGVTTTIAGSAAVLLKINGADYVTIDGSNNGTDSDNLTLNNTNSTSADSPVIAWVASTATDGADNVTLKNIKFLGFSPSGTIGGVLVSGPTLGGAGTIPNNNLRVESNTFNRMQNAVFAIGLATAPDLGAVITENTIGSTDPLEKIGFRGLAVQNASNFTISKNTITGVTTSSTSTASGILVGASVNNGVVTQNKINDVTNTNTTGYGANGIYTNVAAGNGNILISNNFVSNVTGYGYAGLGGVADNGYGIVIGSPGTNIRVYNNTVALNTNQNGAGRPAAINILSTVTVAGSVDLRNNIFVNNQTTTGERYAIYSGAAKTVYSNIDNNDYFTKGNNLAYLGSAVSTLTALQTAFGGNTKSLNIAPIFTSTTDLHLTSANGALNNKATPLAEVTVDIDNVTRNTTTPDLGAAEFNAALNGVYTVGTTGDYTTLTAAVADFNALPIAGPVTFQLLDATYPAETFPIVINANAGSSATNSLLIKPASGVTTTIAGSAAVLLKINGADYVTIDGSNNGTDSDNLTLNNTNSTSADSPVIAWVASTATDGADNVTLKNIKFLGFSPSGTIGGVLVSGPTLGGAGTIPNNNLRVESNTFNRMQNAVFAIGLATAPDLGAVITENTIGSTDPLEKIGFRGLAVQNASNFTISKNTITGVTTSSTSTASGILVGASVNNGVVTQNKINDVTNTNTTGYGANGIYTNVAAGNGNILISNNFVSNVTGYGYAGLGGVADNGYGIVIGSPGTNIRVYNNTVALNTNQNGAGRPAAINILSTVTVAGSVDLRNNIFVNNQTTTGERYAIYSGAAKTVYSNIDNNDYFTKGNNLAYLGSAVSTLTALQTAFGGNTNSLNVLPPFVSTTDLHLSNGTSDVSKKATPLAEVTVDIDGDIRNTTTPDMGADEFKMLAVNDIKKLNVTFYPNPVVDYLSISYTSKIDTLEVYNVAGQKVSTQSLNSDSGSVDMRSLSPGLYIVKMNAGNDIQSFKIIKK